MFTEHLHVPGEKKAFSTLPLFLYEVFYFCVFGMIISFYIIHNLTY